MGLGRKLTALSGEERRRIYEEEGIRFEAQEKLKKEATAARTKKGCLGCLGIIGVSVAIGMVVGLVGLLGGAGGSTRKTTPVPEGMLLDFTTLREWPLRGGGLGVEIVVDEGSSKEQVLILGRFLRDVAWPKGFLNFLVYDNAAAW